MRVLLGGMLSALLIAACSKADPPAPARPNGSSTANVTIPPPAGPVDAGQASQPMNDPEQPGGTGVGPDGVLLRSKPDPDAPKPDAALLADDKANLLFMAGTLAGDPTVQRRVWQKLGLADANGAPTAKMTEFLRAHAEWQKTHQTLVVEHVGTPAQAKAYAEANLK